MANATSSKGTYRKVLLLREDDKKQLQKLSRQEKVSASEICDVRSTRTPRLIAQKSRR